MPCRRASSTPSSDEMPLSTVTISAGSALGRDPHDLRRQAIAEAEPVGHEEVRRRRSRAAAAAASSARCWSRRRRRSRQRPAPILPACGRPRASKSAAASAPSSVLTGSSWSSRSSRSSAPASARAPYTRRSTGCSVAGSVACSSALRVAAQDPAHAASCEPPRDGAGRRQNRSARGRIDLQRRAADAAGRRSAIAACAHARRQQLTATAHRPTCSDSSTPLARAAATAQCSVSPRRRSALPAMETSPARCQPCQSARSQRVVAAQAPARPTAGVGASARRRRRNPRATSRSRAAGGPARGAG